MQVLEEDDIKNMYKEMFGSMPKLTGINWNYPYPIKEMIDAIDSGIPMPDEEEPESYADY
tara:strand:+ start:122 stop:301 length:180 start_codon:yes stop_codon:yes gene_type:complete